MLAPSWVYIWHLRGWIGGRHDTQNSSRRGQESLPYIPLQGRSYAPANQWSGLSQSHPGIMHNFVRADLGHTINSVPHAMGDSRILATGNSKVRSYFHIRKPLLLATWCGQCPQPTVYSQSLAPCKGSAKPCNGRFNCNFLIHRSVKKNTLKKDRNW